MGTRPLNYLRLSLSFHFFLCRSTAELLVCKCCVTAVSAFVVTTCRRAHTPRLLFPLSSCRLLTRKSTSRCCGSHPFCCCFSCGSRCLRRKSSILQLPFSERRGMLSFHQSFLYYLSPLSIRLFILLLALCVYWPPATLQAAAGRRLKLPFRLAVLEGKRSTLPLLCFFSCCSLVAPSIHMVPSVHKGRPASPRFWQQQQQQHPRQQLQQQQQQRTHRRCSAAQNIDGGSNRHPQQDA